MPNDYIKYLIEWKPHKYRALHPKKAAREHVESLEIYCKLRDFMRDPESNRHILATITPEKIDHARECLQNTRARQELAAYKAALIQFIEDPETIHGRTRREDPRKASESAPRARIERLNV